MSVKLDLTVISSQPLTLANSRITSTVIINKRPELWLKPLYVCAISGCSFAALCNPKSSNRRCCLPADPGLCMGYFPRFFFNGTSEQCEEFIYGGCGGNENNFEKEGDCKASCKPGKENRALLFIKDWRKETLALTTIYCSIFLSVVLDIASPAETLSLPFFLRDMYRASTSHVSLYFNVICRTKLGLIRVKISAFRNMILKHWSSRSQKTP